MSILKLFVDTFASFEKEGNDYLSLNGECYGLRFINENLKKEKLEEVNR